MEGDQRVPHRTGTHRSQAHRSQARHTGARRTGERRGEATRTGGVLTLPNLIDVIRPAGVPVFLWLVVGPQADG